MFGAAAEERWVFPNEDVPPATWQETLDLLEDSGLSLTDAVPLAHLDGTVVRKDHLVSYVLDRMTRAYTGVSKDLAASGCGDQGEFSRGVLCGQRQACQRFGDLLADMIGVARPDWDGLDSPVVAAGKVVDGA